MALHDRVTMPRIFAILHAFNFVVFIQSDELLA